MTRSRIVPERRFVATVTMPDGSTFTTTVYGHTVPAAEAAGKATHGATMVVVRDELR